VDIALDAAPQIASGTTASVTFPASGAIAQGSAAAQIPAEALVDNNQGRGHVYIVEPRTMVARLTPVAVLGINGEHVRVQGLPLHTRVITAGAGFVADGQRITVQGQ